MATLVVGIVGVLGGGLISMLTSLLTLRSSQHAEHARWAADRRWEHASGLAKARLEAYTRFLSQQNAVIMAAGSTMHKVQEDRQVLREMPRGQAAAYQALEDAWAQSLLLASPRLRTLLEEVHTYLNELVWASWRGEQAEGRDALYEDVLAAMREEAVEQPHLLAVPLKAVGWPGLGAVKAARSRPRACLRSSSNGLHCPDLTDLHRVMFGRHDDVPWGEP